PSAQSRLPSSLSTARDSPSSRASFISQSAIDRPAGLSGRQVSASAFIGDDRRLGRDMESYGISREGKGRDGNDEMGRRRGARKTSPGAFRDFAPGPAGGLAKRCRENARKPCNLWG